MVLHNTWGVAGTYLAITWVLALEVDTGLVPGTPLVLEADGDTWVTSGGADTDRLVVQYLALLACGTHPSSVTRVDTSTCLASLVGGTLVITSTLNLSVWTREDTLLVDHEAVLAFADWFVVADLADLVAVTGEPRAWVIALLGLPAAGGSERTALVTGATLDNRGQVGGGDIVTGWVRATTNQRLTNVTLRTLTPSLVDNHGTDGVLAAGSAEAAWVNTLTSMA